MRSRHFHSPLSDLWSVEDVMLYDHGELRRLLFRCNEVCWLENGRETYFVDTMVDGAEKRWVGLYSILMK